MAGYSGTPLAKKLGIKPGSRVNVLHAPPGFAIEGLPEDVRPMASLRGAVPADVIVLFCKKQAVLESKFDAAQQRLATAGGLWIAWPKKASGVATDLNDGIVRDFGLLRGLVDNKVCAIDDVWSGLRFVRRLKDR